MSPRWRKVLRDVWLHTPRTLLVVLAIAIGIVGAGSVLNTWSLVRTVTRDEFRASNPASATLRTDALDAETMTAVRGRDDIADAQARRSVVGSMRAPDGARTLLLFARDDFGDTRIGRIVPEHGAWPPAEGGVVVESSSLEFSGLALGDSVLVQVGEAPPARLAVAGVARDVGLAPGWMEHVVYGFVDRATLTRLGVPNALNELQIVARGDAMNRDAVRRVAFGVKAMLERAGHPVTDVDVPVPGRHIHAAQMDSLLFTQGAFGLLALLLSGFLVVNLISAMLAGQVREIGVMKAVGARSHQVAGLYLTLALVLGIVACVIAVPMAAVIGRAYAQFTADLLNFSIAGIAIPRGVIVLQLAVGALLPVVAASLPVLRGCGITVAEALRDFGITAQAAGAPPGRLLRRATGVTRPLLFSLRNAFRKRQRMVLTLVTLATGGAVYLGAINLRASVSGSVDLLYRPQRFDLSLRLAKPVRADSLETAVRRVAGVQAAEAWSAGRAAVARNDGTLGNSFAVSAPPADSRLFVPDVARGRWLAAGDTSAIVINTRLAGDDSLLVPGRAVTLVVGGRTTSWTIVGVAETGPSPAAFVARDRLAGLLSEGRVDRVVVAGTVSGDAAQLDLIQRLRSELARDGYVVQSSQLAQASRAAVEDHLLMVAGFLGIMSQLMIIVGGLGLAATMSIAVLERTREIGVLRAIGARHRSIVMIVQVEGLVIAGLSWLLALPLSIPMSVVLAKAFGRIMLPVPIVAVPDAAAVLRWLGVVVAVSLVSCAWPAIRATRITTAAALAYE